MTYNPSDDMRQRWSDPDFRASHPHKMKMGRLLARLKKYISDDDVNLSKMEFLVMVRDRINDDLRAG